MASCGDHVGLGSETTRWVELGMKRVSRFDGGQTELFRAVADAMAEGLVVADEQGEFVYLNPTAAHILGIGPAGSDASEWSRTYRVFLPDQGTLFPQEDYPLSRALRGERTDAVEQFICNAGRPDGVFVRVSGRPIADAAGRITGAVAAFRDVTEERRDKEKIERLNDRLASKMHEIETVNAELKSFSYSVSHDLRAPLRSMIGYSTIILEDFGDALPEEAKGHLGRIIAATNRMGGLIDGLLALSRITRRDMDRKTVDLSELAEEALRHCRETDPNRKVATRVTEQLTATGDRQLLQIAVGNFIENAWKFTKHAEQPRIEVGVRNEHEQPVYYVRDNGAGFDMRYADKLFGAFHRLHGEREYEGAGIGLAMAHRAILRHRGSVWAEAEPDRGATFYFTVPEPVDEEEVE
jgi:signal transduction histidine kinase